MQENSQAIEIAHKTYSMSAVDMYELEQMVGSLGLDNEPDEGHDADELAQPPDSKGIYVVWN